MISVLLKAACWFTRTFPRTRGRYRLIKWLSKQEHWLEGLGWSEIKIRDAGRMKVLPAEFIGRGLFLCGVYEEDILRPFKYLIKPGDRVIDVGANIGFFTLVAGRLCGSEGKVFSFEASPEIFEILKHNVEINEKANIVLHQCAVGDKNGEAQFHPPNRKNMGMGSLRKLEGGKERAVLVPLRRLDELDSDLHSISLIKIDVEGAEPMVLAGARRILERDKPLIIMELTDEFSKQLGSSSQEAVNLLQDLGYSMFLIEAGFHEIKTAPREQTNLFCVPNDQRNVVEQFLRYQKQA